MLDRGRQFPASLPVVDPIWAVLISGGWAAVVAAIGYRFNRATAKATIQATNINALAALDAAHQAQLWEKKAEAYREALAAITRRSAARSHLTSPLKYDEDTEERIRESYASPQDWDWAAMSAGLIAFATEPILDALRYATEADMKVRQCVRHQEALTKREQSQRGPLPGDDELADAWKAIPEAAEAAGAADKALEKLIRVDLSLRPSERVTFAVLNARAIAKKQAPEDRD